MSQLSNKAILFGRIGQDLELRQLDGGQSVQFSVATDESYRNKDGERVEQTEWHNVVFYGKQAEVICKFFKKGFRILVEGKLKTRKWVDKDGINRYTTEIVGHFFEFIDRIEASTGADTNVSGNGPEDDLPF